MSVPDAERIEKFYWKTPEDVIAVTHGNQIPIDPIPAGIQSLAGTGIANQLLVLIKVRDETGAVIGSMTELEISLPNGEMDVYMNIVIPGRGTLYIHEIKKGSTPPQVQAAFDQAQATGDWTGELYSNSTAGPLPGEFGDVIAGTGEFAGMRGRQKQMIIWRNITRAVVTADNIETIWLTPANT